MNYHSTKRIFLCVFSVLSFTLAQSQNCFNSDFESGSASGYETYIGEIDVDGNVIINTSQLDPDRHKLTSIVQGYDAIAMEFCTDNKYLPVVPPSGGLFAMRLGNSNVGAEAERIVLRFTVTTENSFFLLRYAVLLNDPSHAYHEQPRFRLSIKDQNGDEYPCGFYEVVAAPNLDNFENCEGDWKVRPWTNIGIELLSYIGEEIIIEMMTTDCALGGHAGFAYLDATCSPLEIELFGNCSDTSTAIMRVTPGFDAYQWSTGDTGSEIQIPNPVVGDIYYVTVTSATGCQLELFDTIPPYDVAVDPFFGAATSNNYCVDSLFWFTPEGSNLQQIYSVTHQAFIDSVLINTIISNEYTFIAYSDAGCAFDTVTHYFGGLPFVLDLQEEPLCPTSNDGSITLFPLDSTDIYEYQWFDNSNNDAHTMLEGGIYYVTVTDAAGCSIVKEYTLGAPELFSHTVQIEEFLCNDVYGAAFIDVQGGTFPYAYSYDNGNNFVPNDNYHEEFVEGPNTVLVKDDNDCIYEIIVTFEPPTNPEFGVLTVNTDSCGNNNSSILVNNMIDMQFPLEYSINNSTFDNINFFDNLSPGAYTIVVKDANDCQATTVVIIQFIEKINFSQPIVEPASCELANGSIAIEVNNTEPITYALGNGSFQNSNQFNNLTSGLYMGYIKYRDNCIDSIPINLDGSLRPIIEDIDIQHIPCSDGKSTIEVSGNQGALPYRYQLDLGALQSSNSFNNITSGQHTIKIIDAKDCETEEAFFIDHIDTFTYNLTNVLQPTCGEANGEIVIQTFGGLGTSMIEYDGDLYDNQYSFDGLLDGNHSFTIIDQGSCSHDFEVPLKAYCTVYVPNIFSPNGDKVNDFLTINIAENATGTINQFNVFDRWGERIYSLSDEPINGPTKHTWDGIFKGKLCNVGVFVYHLEMTMYNTQLIELSGTVTVSK